MNIFRSRKSGGVRVSAAVHRLIRRGDALRAGGHWAEAAEAYRQALEMAPSLTHIWVQYGHMSKEAGSYFTATAAYVEAACLAPDDPGTLRWLYTMPGKFSAGQRQRLSDALRSSHGEMAATSSEGQPNETVFDISDLVSYFAKARLPTGIQRVQTETVRSLVREGTAAIRVCCSIEGRGEWVEVPTSLFLRLADLSVRSSDNHDPQWLAALNALNLSLLLADPIRFGDRATLVNLGTSWWLQDYFLQVRNAKAQYGVRYVPFVHDLIPIVRPEHCIEGLIRDFVSWIIGVFEHADGFLVASHATERDLHAVAAIMGHTVPPERIGHVPLDADFRSNLPSGAQDIPLPHAVAAAGSRYVLFVSTIESRKGHTVALDAWQTLIDRHGSDVPTLVCVGNDGWLNEDVYAKIARSPALKARVVFLSGISDADLARLYQGCIFTLYPSLYEGWGLPITEALCYGKPVIACDNSSLMQAGGAFAIYVETGSVADLARAVESLCFDEVALAEAYARVKGFKPRPWHEIGQDIIALTDALPAPRGAASLCARPIVPGTWYSLSRNAHTRVWHGIASAEMYRIGTGWAVLDEHCAWILPGGARLSIPHDGIDGSCRLIVRLVARNSATVRLTSKGSPLGDAVLSVGEKKWLMLQIELDESENYIVDIITDAASTEQGVSVGLVGFAICLNKAEAINDVLEEIVFGDLDNVTAFLPNGR